MIIKFRNTNIWNNKVKWNTGNSSQITLETNQNKKKIKNEKKTVLSLIDYHFL